MVICKLFERKSKLFGKAFPLWPRKQTKARRILYGAFCADRSPIFFQEMGPLPPELMSLADELASLGGGNARVGSAAVLCSVRQVSPGSSSIVETKAGGSVVCVCDPRMPRGTPEAQAVREFRVSVGGTIEHSADYVAEADEAAAQLFDTAGASALEWLLAGFSSSVLAIGESGSGKTRALFGPRVRSSSGRSCAARLDAGLL